MNINVLVETLVKCGLEVEMSYDKNIRTIMYDLSVCLKSRMVLYVENDIIYCKQRYDRSDKITSLKSLIEVYEYWFEDAKARFNEPNKTLPLEWANIYELANINPK